MHVCGHLPSYFGNRGSKLSISYAKSTDPEFSRGVVDVALPVIVMITCQHHRSVEANASSESRLIRTPLDRELSSSRWYSSM